MSVSLKIAVRFLKSSRGQTILIVLGIAIGISVQIFIGSLIQGLQKSLVETTIGNASQITVVSPDDDKRFSDPERVMQAIRQAEGQITALSPALDQAGLATDGDETGSVLIRGLDFAAAEPIYALADRIVQGRLPSASDEAVIGKVLQAEWDVAIGDTLDVTVAGGKRLTYTVCGVFDLQVQSLNTSWFLTTLASAQERFDLAGQVTSIEMQVESGDVFLADTIAAELQALPELMDLEVTNWKAQNEQLLSGLNGQSVSSIMIQVFVVVSVVLAIASVLAISVMQKSRQIGILKAMGIKSRQASLVFLYQGLILGVLGGLAGVALGLGLAYSFTVFARNPDGTPVVALLIDPAFFVLSFLIAVTASSLASLIPARKSARLDPIEVIRNG
ncbi:MAG: ABC transporter permease [Clostridiaceae bacterium]|jgi:lipoprotein-releasing system permease protein|nr:ABC transporter permease [Eubacteriales bacterium]MDD4139194.1 ABC transporter permease [Eubacteriales bacterium]MDD4744849.1 ABC transporter permease [Eubacteriales bacterium]NLB43829.1 ABC transporter permease [Clostridiaceae bacterium]